MLKVEKIIPGGMGLATREDGKKVFLWNALPGEVVGEFRTVKEKSSYILGTATEILERSEFRERPLDDCFLATSPWQVMEFGYENQLKRELVSEMFLEQGIEIATPEILTDGTDYYYRNKMEYALYFSHESQKIELAFHERGSHRKTPIAGSSIERPEILAKAREIVANLNARGEEARKYQSMLLRCNQKGEVSGGLYKNHAPHPSFPALSDTILGFSYTYSPNGFFQINLPVYELALEKIREEIFGEEVLDLYAGVGTIGLTVAREKKLTLVESDKSAFLELQKNVLGTGAEAVLEKSEEAPGLIREGQTVILDPPRAGCDEKLIEKLLEVVPEKIIYLSCNPMTQARDVKKLLEKYEIQKITAFNFFPRTPHIENLVVLSKK